MSNCQLVLFVYVTFSAAHFSSVAMPLMYFVSIFIVVHNRKTVKPTLPRLVPFRAVQHIQLVNLRVSRDTMQIELDSYHCKCTFQSTEIGWKARTNPLQGSVAIRIFKCVFHACGERMELEFMFCWPASRYNSCKWPTWRTVLFSYMFIPNLYMFRAFMCSSSGELIVLIRHLVYVTLCRWPSGVQVWVPPKPTYQTVTYIVTYTRCRIDTINSPDDEHMSARNM